MRVSRQDAEENRSRVVEQASHLFREHGFDGIGIAALMKSAGLTNGAFYKQFASKDALIAEATKHAFSENLEAWRTSIAAARNDTPAQTVANWYLSEQHAEDRAAGCTLAALGGDAPRQSPEVRKAFDEGLREMAQLLSFENEDKDSDQHQEALRQLSTLVGALVLSRAVEDPELKNAILSSAGAG